MEIELSKELLQIIGDKEDCLKEMKDLFPDKCETDRYLKLKEDYDECIFKYDAKLRKAAEQKHQLELKRNLEKNSI